ncbi:MAG: DUF6286 domain-containing protein [Corynebacterium sp.]|nr:DUF6286 domain-containing protein [Corynebacterium sp.]
MSSQEISKKPRFLTASPLARWGGILVGIVLLAVAFLAAHEIWAFDTRNPSVLLGVNDALHDTTQPAVLIAAAAIFLILGLWCLFAALRPRQRTHVPWGEQQLWLRPVDIANVATKVAKTVPGVGEVKTVATLRKITVHVEPLLPASSTDNSIPTLEKEVFEKLSESFAGMGLTKIRVRIGKAGA